MDFKELEKSIITGHNIEFEYDNNKYAIVKGTDGFCFSNMQNKNEQKIYSNPLELLIKTNVNGKNLSDISENMNDINIH